MGDQVTVNENSEINMKKADIGLFDNGKQKKILNISSIISIKIFMLK